MVKISKFFNLAPDWWRSKTMWVSAIMLSYIGFKYSQNLISLDQLFQAFYVVIFGASLRDTIAKLYPALLMILGDVRGKQGTDG